MKTREKSVPYVPGTCARRLNQYMYHQERRPHENDIRYWRKFVDEYYAPSAKKRWCVSLCGSNHPTITGVLPQDVWHCEICYRRPGRGFEATFEELPQLYQTKYASGTVQELLYIDMPRESQSTSGQIILDYSQAVQESVFEQLRVVRPGHLRVIYNPADYKIESWEFCIRRHEEFIPRGSIIPQVTLGPAVQKYQAAVQNSTSLLAQNMQNNCNLMDICNGLRLLENILDGSEKPTKLHLSVLRHITRNFSDEQKIGHGGCGDVYKGIVKNGTVAVKRLFNCRTIDDNMFHLEVTTMMRVKHENIVRFLGFCSHTEENLIEIEGKIIMAEERERLLCFEYANNGSLKDHVTDELRGFEWHIRYQIIKGICNGLHHLHKEKNIIHMDLKPANILLDDHMVPKITDFGISRLNEKSQTMSQERLISLGYCAPEYQLNGKISLWSDIYSLGIVMMELVTGYKEKPNIANILRRWRYRWNNSNKHKPMEYHQVKKCIELAQRCVHEDPTKRPLIWDIISELNQMENGNPIQPTPCKIISSLEDMLGIEPLELHFPFDPSKKMSHSVQLTNNTDYYIAFRISTMNQLPYCIQPNKAVVPPQSCRNVTISLEIYEKEPQYKYYTQEFSVQSTRVDADITTEDITHEMFTEVTDRVVDKVSLTVVLGMPQSPCCVPHLSAHKGSARPSSQMAANMLSELNPHGLNWNIRVCISRLWEFYNKDGQIKHLDLVVVDEKNNAMYAEIPPEDIPYLKAHLQEGKIVNIKRFLVQRAKNIYKVVEAPYMIKLTQRSIITPVVPEPPNFPKHVYNLIPFSEVPQHANLNDRFLDIIGYVTAVSNVAKVQYGYGKLETKRTVILKDDKGNSLEVSLWGPRATEFDAETVFANGQQTAVIIIFVGTLAKNIKTDKGDKVILTGSSACRWYINEDIPAINELYSKLLEIEDEMEPIQAVYLHGDDETAQHIQKKSLLQLKKEIDPVDHKNQKIESTITITRLAPNQGWWYRACKSCHSKTFLHSSTYKCTNDNCVCTEAVPRYKLCVTGSDNTYELEFVLFDKKAEQLIGKPVEKLCGTYGKSDIPAEIAALIGQKYTFVVKISSKKSFASKDPSFEVLYITQQFGKQTSIPSFEKLEQSSSSAISLSTPRHVPPLLPIKYKIDIKQDEVPLLQKSQTDVVPMEIESTEEQNCNKNKRDQPSDHDNNSDDEYKPIKEYLPKAKKAKQ